ncbi:MAG TPA: cytochrome c1 [Casimicrobiaceae bacterium]|nr:cytochrome c1 [Casimicrobiaceae bacterium]
MMTRTAWVVALALLASVANAMSGPDVRMERPVLDVRDTESLQRGAKLFVNYCLNCHGAKYMRYNRLTDLGLTEPQIANNLIFPGRFEEAEDGTVSFVPTKVGETMQSALRVQDGKAWFGAAPPDLSVEARVRGTQWLYNYMIGFYRDDQTATGWNNLVFPNVAMPHVLWQLSGVNRVVTTEYPSHEAAQGAALAERTVVAIEPAPNHKYVVKTLKADTPGTMSGVDYKRAVADLVNFLDYVGEPAKTTRIRTGIVVMLYLVVLFAATYWLKRAYWKGQH